MDTLHIGNKIFSYNMKKWVSSMWTNKHIFVSNTAAFHMQLICYEHYNVAFKYHNLVTGGDKDFERSLQ